MNESTSGFTGFKAADAPAIDPKLKTIRVKAKNFVTVDGLQFNEGQEGLITPDQYIALARNFELLGGEWHTSPKVRLNKGDKIKDGIHIGKNEDGEIVKTPIKGAIIKAAALIALMIGLIRLICPISVQAAPPASYGLIPILYSQNGSNVYNTNETLVYPINPAVGTSTNGQTNAYNVFPLTNVIGGPSGGGSIALNTTNFLTNAAGLSGSLPINLTRFDEITLVISYSQITNTGAQSINTTNVVQFLVSGDGTNWGTINTNVWQFSLSPTATINGGTNAVLVTNITRFSPQCFSSQGYLQLSFDGCMGTNSITNPIVQIYAKPVRSGN